MEMMQDVRVLSDSPIKYLLKHNIKQGLDKKRQEYLINANKISNEFTNRHENQH